jgi:DNA-binding transcriptional ArsR family regulator
MKYDKPFLHRVKVYKALGEPTRMRIVQLLCQHKELSCNELLTRLQLTVGSTISHHLKLLLNSEILDLRKEGTFHYYSLQQETLEQFAPELLK